MALAITEVRLRQWDLQERSDVQTYEIHCGSRIVSRVNSFTPRHAVTDYLRSLGCRDDDMEPMGSDAVAWRGALYTAVETTESTPGKLAVSERSERRTPTSRSRAGFLTSCRTGEPGGSACQSAQPCDLPRPPDVWLDSPVRPGGPLWSWFLSPYPWPGEQAPSVRPGGPVWS